MSTKNELDKIIADAKAKKFREGEAKGLISEIQKEQTKALAPILEQISRDGSERMVAAFERAVRNIKIDIPEIQIPNISIPPISLPSLPRIPAPIINYTPPAINMPEIKMPAEIGIRGWTSLMGYDKGLLLNPLPVQLRNADGSPLDLLKNLTQVLSSRGGGSTPAPSMQSWGGGKADFLTIKGYSQSAFADLQNPDGRIKVELPTGSSGLTDTELRASHLDTQQVSGAIDSVKVTGFDSTVGATIVDSSGVGYSGSNPLPVTITSGGSATSASNVVDSSGVAYSGSNPLPVTVVSENIALDQTTDSIAVRQVSGFADSVFITGPVDQGDAASALRTVQAGNSVSSVYVNNPVDKGDSATALRVVVAGDSDVSVTAKQTGNWAIQVQDSLNSAITSHQFNTDFRGLDVYVGGFATSVGASLQDSSGVQYSGSNPLPVLLAAGSNNTVAAANIDSSGVQYSGSNPFPFILAGNSAFTVAAALVDSSGVEYSGSNPFPFVLAANSVNTVGAALVDSSGVEYSGSNPVPVTLVSGALTSTVSVGDSAARASDNGGNPVKVGGIARQTNPVAFADGDRSNISTDDLGRQLTRPVQVRDLIATAFATFTTGTEATLLAGSAAAYYDLIYILASNNSTVAVGIDIRAGSGGSIVMHLEIPANGTVGVAAPVPIPQQATGDGTGGSWTVDLPDITGTTVSVAGLFSKEI